MDHVRAQPAQRPARFAVFGHANLEVSAAIGEFPLTYTPDQSIPDGISVGVAGTAYNVGIGLWRLGNEVDLCVTIGQDPVAAFVTASFPADERLRIIPASVPEQPVTVVLTGQVTQRLILLDHRAARGFRHAPATAGDILDHADVVVLPVGPVNTDLAEYLARRDRTRTATVACDVHAISGLTGPHEPFCAAADILFMSDERLPLPVQDWLAQVMDRWRVQLAVLGQGGRGATLAVRGDPQLHHVPAARTGEIVSTLGAGDALCAGFLDGYTRGLPPSEALQRATVFAAAKLAAVGGAAGFLTADQLHAWLTAPQTGPGQA
jgi:sugar/nucleoside kinase (ribokinase family)